MINPYAILAFVVALFISHGYAYYIGGEHVENKIKAEQLEATNAAIVQADNQAFIDSNLSAKEVVIQEKIKIEYRYIREKANENIEKNSDYSECGLDADGLYIFNSGAAAETPDS